jgi:hypothetical protein
MKKIKYDLIILIQSYPNLIDAINYALNFDGEDLLILVNGDRKIFKFLNESIQKPNISIKLYGNNLFLRSRYFCRFLPLYVCYLNFRIPNYNCNEKLITYGNMCDIGALLHYKTKSKQTTKLVAYEEKRYDIRSADETKLPIYIKLINLFTNNMLEKKIYFYEEDGNTKSIPRDIFGLVKSEKWYKTIQASQDKNYDLLKRSLKKIIKPYILYIEKNLIKSNAISYYGFIKLNLAISRMSKKNNIDIFIKFKPRDRFFFRYFYYRLMGFLILPTHIPAQLYAIHDKCSFIIGFASSSMAQNYDKPVYVFSSLKKLFNPNVYGNVNSLRQRSSGNKNCIYLENLQELENLEVQLPNS